MVLLCAEFSVNHQWICPWVSAELWTQGRTHATFYRMFSLEVTAASQNNEAVAMLAYQANPMGFEQICEPVGHVSENALWFSFTVFNLLKVMYLLDI